MTPGTSFKQQLKLLLQRWLDKRQPATADLVLRQHLLFVFPTLYGLWCVLLTVLLYVFGSNYQNNLILLCAYLLLSLLCCCILAAFFNLYKLRLQTPLPSSVPVFSYAHQPLLLSLRLSHTEHKKMLTLSSPDFQTVQLESLPAQLHLELYPRRRGSYQLQRFTLESCYPFGLIRCWTHIKLQQPLWFYPSPVGLLTTTTSHAATIKDQLDQLAPYQPGDPLVRVDWKRLAKNPWQPVVRHHSLTADITAPHKLVVNTTGALREQQLAEFCRLIHQFEQQGERYSLTTESATLGPDLGQTHFHHCLQALALC